MTNLTWTNLGLNLGLSGEGPTISFLNCCMATMIDNKTKAAVQNEMICTLELRAYYILEIHATVQLKICCILVLFLETC